MAGTIGSDPIGTLVQKGKQKAAKAKVNTFWVLRSHIFEGRFGDFAVSLVPPAEHDILCAKGWRTANMRTWEVEFVPGY